MADTHFYPRFILRLAVLLALVALVAPASAQDATPSVMDNADPATITKALETADPPAELPGNIDVDIELETWEEYYGDLLEGVEGAWVLIGSPEFPLATLIVFPSSDNARAGIGGYGADAVEFTVSGLDAWTVADRGKWVCIVAAGPVIVLGQAFPEDINEPEDEVEQQSCDVVEASLAWLSDDVLETSAATPSASPASEFSG